MPCAPKSPGAAATCAALRELDDFAFDLPAPGRNSPLGSSERFLRAELLLALHRDAEALTWYESTPTYDTPYMAAAQLRQAQIQGHLGNRERQAFISGASSSSGAIATPSCGRASIRPRHAGAQPLHSWDTGTYRGMAKLLIDGAPWRLPKAKRFSTPRMSASRSDTLLVSHAAIVGNCASASSPSKDKPS